MSWKNDQVSRIETAKIIELAREALKTQGDFVELGCYMGDTSLLLAEVLQNISDKQLFIYDSFEGLPEKSKEDESMTGGDFRRGELLVSKKEVKRRFLRANLPVPVIKKAWFSELTSDDLPKKIVFAFLDGDFYESIKDSLKLIEDKIAKGAIVVIHDYNNASLPGVARAVDEWLRGKNQKVEVYQSMMIIRF